MNITASLLASLIAVNCESYFAGRISRRTWDREQRRLWTIAANRGLSLQVAKLAAPQLGGVR